MNELAPGVPNVHADITALKPIDERVDLEEHPSQVININGQYNYFTYSWMVEADEASAKNYAALGGLSAIIAVCAYLTLGTKLVKFIQFFVTRKQYKRLDYAIKAAADDVTPIPGTIN